MNSSAMIVDRMVCVMWTLTHKVRYVGCRSSECLIWIWVYGMCVCERMYNVVVCVGPMYGLRLPLCIVGYSFVPKFGRIFFQKKKVTCFLHRICFNLRFLLCCCHRHTYSTFFARKQAMLHYRQTMFQTLFDLSKKWKATKNPMWISYSK